MPTYEYRCLSCEEKFELFRKMNEMSREEVCPACQSTAALKVSVGAIFGEEASWINDEVRHSLQNEKEIKQNPILTRSDHKRVLKEKGLVERM